MQALFLKLLSMSIAGGAVILVVLLARLMLARSPKKWSYLLWLAVALRLCLPLSIQSPLSVFGLLPQKAEIAQTVVYVPAIIQTETGSDVAYTAAEPPSDEAAPQPAKPEAPASAGTEHAAELRPSKVVKTDALTVCAVVWCAGASVMIVYAIAVSIKLRRLLVSATRRENGVYESESVHAPFVLGLIRPRIYIPYGVEADTLCHVIAHERSHIARGDHIIKAFSYLLLALHWFNPLCWLAFYLSSRDMEMSCDERVLSSCGDARRDYSNALLSFAVGKRFPAPSPLGFGENAVRSRIINAMKWKKPKKIVSIISALLCLVVLTACATDPIKPADKTSEPGTTSAPRTAAAPYRDGDTVFIPAAFPGDTVPEGVAAAGYSSESGIKGPESFAVLDNGKVMLLDTVNARVIEYDGDSISAHELANCKEPVLLFCCKGMPGGITFSSSGSDETTIVLGISYSVGGDGTVWNASMMGSGYFVIDAASDRMLACGEDFESSELYALPKGVKAADVSSLYFDGQGLHLVTKAFENCVLTFGPAGEETPIYSWRNDPHFYYTRYEGNSVFIIYGKTYTVPVSGEAELRIIGFGDDSSLYVSAYDEASGLVLYRIAADGEVIFSRPVSDGGLYRPANDFFLSADGSLFNMLCTEDGVIVQPIPEAE